MRFWHHDNLWWWLRLRWLNNIWRCASRFRTDDDRLRRWRGPSVFTMTSRASTTTWLHNYSWWYHWLHTHRHHTGRCHTHRHHTSRCHTHRHTHRHPRRCHTHRHTRMRRTRRHTRASRAAPTRWMHDYRSWRMHYSASRYHRHTNRCHTHRYTSRGHSHRHTRRRHIYTHTRASRTTPTPWHHHHRGCLMHN